MSLDQYRHLTSYGKRHVIWMDVTAELDRQDQMWGKPAAQDQTPERRLAILAEEFGEVARAVLERDAARVREELVQVAAVAIANIERIDSGLDR